MEGFPIADASLFGLLTNDVETTSLVNKRLDDNTGKIVLREGMPRLLELYARYGVKSTFFFTGYIAEKFPDIVKMILADGHEVACHGYSHKVEKAFDVLSFEDQKRHLRRAKDILEDICGCEVVSFRAPALRVNSDTPKALIETGFQVDSSISPQRLDMFMSFGSIKKLNWIFAPRLPYFTNPNDLSKRGDGPIFEIPISALGMPYIGTTMRIFPRINGFIGAMLIRESKRNSKPLNFLIHPNELIDEERDANPLIKRTSNPVKGFFADYLRYKLKLKNLGAACLPLYEKEIIRMKKNNFEFVTLKEYYNLVVSKRIDKV